MIPNVIHYVYPAWPNTRPLSYVNYICIKSAIEKHKPKDVKFWIDGNPVDNEWWQKIKAMVSVHHRPMTGEFGGTKIEWPQYQSDVTRLQILKEEGGVYLDTDVIVLKSLERFQKGSKFTLAAEPGLESVCNAIMMCEKNDLFLDEWLEILPEALKSSTWANGGVVRPYELADAFWRINLRDPEDFCPLDLHYPYMFEPRLNRAGRALIGNAYTVHLFETYWRDTIKHVTPEWVEKTDCLFSMVVKGTFDDFTT